MLLEGLDVAQKYARLVSILFQHRQVLVVLELSLLIFLPLTQF